MNYFKLKESAPDQTLYMKKDGQMVFVHLEDTTVVKELTKLLDTKDEEIAILNSEVQKLDNAVRLIEKALNQRGIKL